MYEDLFPEPAAPLPEAASRGFAVFRPLSEKPAPVWFADGFAEFAGYAAVEGVAPDLLVADLPRLLSFLSAHPGVLESDSLAASAGAFFGNVLAVLDPRARWQVTTEPEIRLPGVLIPVVSAIRLLVNHPERHEDYLAHVQERIQAEGDPPGDPSHRLPPRTLVRPPVPFQRPAFPSIVYRDAAGEVIDYGDRYPDSPPDDAYSRVSHPERFRPLVTDAEALVAYLHRFFDVEIEARDGDGGSRITMLVPAAGASVEVTCKEDVVSIRAGQLYWESFPSCGCDACDSTAEGEADGLEDALLAIAGGGLRERYPVDGRRWTKVELISDHGSQSSSGPLDHDTHDPAAVTAALAILDDGWWPAWPLRTA